MYSPVSQIAPDLGGAEIPAGWSVIDPGTGTFTVITEDQEVYIDKAVPVVLCSESAGVINGMYVEPFLGMRPFELNNKVSILDFGNVKNGDTNGLMDAFILEPAEGESDQILVGSGDDLFLARANENGIGVLLAVVGGEEVYPLYATAETEIEGVHFTKGYQSLTDGKLTLDRAFDIDLVNDNITGWNGILVGCVVDDSLTLFNDDGTQYIAGYEFDTSLSTEEIKAILSKLTYQTGDTDFGMCMVVSCGETYGLAAMKVISTNDYYIAAVDDGNAHAIYGSKPGTVGEIPFAGGFENLTDGKYHFSNADTLNVTFVNNDDGWNGIFIGAIEAEPSPTLTRFNDDGTQYIVGYQADTSKSVDEVVSILSQLDYEEEGDQGQCFLLQIGPDNDLLIQRQRMSSDSHWIYAIVVNGDTPIFCSEEIPEVFPQGWFGLDSDGKINLAVGESTLVSKVLQGSRWNNGSILGAVIGEPEPSSLTPFSVGQTITGFDFGNVQNGDTSAAMDAFLAGLSYDEDGMCFLVSFSPDASILGMCEPNEGLYGLVLGENIILYANKTVAEYGITAGFSNLTNGKYELGETLTVSILYGVEGWNGILIGAVEAEPGPTPSLTPFSVGQTVTGYEFDTSAQKADILSVLSQINYSDGNAILATGLDGVTGLGAFHQGTLYLIAYMSEDFSVTPLWANETGEIVEAGVSYVEGFQNLNNGVYSIPDGGYEVTFVNETQGWNGVVVGAVTE